MEKSHEKRSRPSIPNDNNNFDSQRKKKKNNPTSDNQFEMTTAEEVRTQKSMRKE